MKDFLLIDCVGYAQFTLTESTNGRVKFSGKFQEANAVNKNKRLYPYEVLASNVDKLQETVVARGLYGELDHPTDSIVHLANASHLITKLWWEGNVLMGEGEILPTPSGMILRKLIESGCRVGMSSRGVGNGTTNSEGILEIGESYKLISFDCVADPSTFQAFQTKVTSKHEAFEQRVIKSTVIENKVNHRALVSYLWTQLDSKLNELKESIRNK